MTPKAKQRIDTWYDAFHDVVVAYPRWTLGSRADVTAWLAAWLEALAPYRKKPDIVVVLDDFHVGGEALLAWGEARARLNNELFGISFRVHSDPTTRAAILTSGVTYSTATSEAESVDAAVQGILAMRRQAGLPERGASARARPEQAAG